MSKLVYPNDGIYKYCRDDIDVLCRRLNKITLNCDFDVPSDFDYKDYLNRLGSIINGCYEEVKSINYKLQSSNEKFEKVEADSINDTKKMVVTKIKDRDRMIV